MSKRPYRSYIKTDEENKLNKLVGEKIKIARKIAKLTQTKLAIKLNVSFQQIGKYEKGQNRIPIVNLIRISKFLNKPLDYFLDINKETMIQSFMAKINNEMRK